MADLDRCSFVTGDKVLRFLGPALAIGIVALDAGCASNSGTQVPQGTTGSSSGAAASTGSTSGAVSGTSVSGTTSATGSTSLSGSTSTSGSTTSTSGTSTTSGTTSSSGSTSTTSGAASGTGASAGSSSGAVTSGTSSGVATSGTTPLATCGTFTQLGGALPFVVDAPTFIAAGWEDDWFDIQQDAPSGCPARSHAGAMGSCHRWTYSSMVLGEMNDAGMTAKGGAGVAWQSGVMGPNNFGVNPGAIIPAGATKVSFWAKGAVGGESLTFGYGGLTPGGAVVCGDAISNTLTQTLTNQWVNYTIPVTGNYSAGMVTGFYWYSGQVVTDAGLPDGSITFFIDDIEWQM